ncbi:hypothetical protein ACFE04_030872 [Oxalis oulophora]
MKHFQIMNVILVLLLVILPFIIASDDDDKSIITATDITTTSKWQVPWFKLSYTIKITTKDGPRHLPALVRCTIEKAGNSQFGRRTILEDLGRQRIKAGHSWSFTFWYTIFPAAPPKVYCTFKWTGFSAGKLFIFPFKSFPHHNVIVQPEGPGCKVIIGEMEWITFDPSGKGYYCSD